MSSSLIFLALGNYLLVLVKILLENDLSWDFFQDLLCVLIKN